MTGPSPRVLPPRARCRRALPGQALLCLALAAGAGCGYRLSGANRFLPGTIRTIAIPAFENETTREEIEQRITEAVAEEFIRRGHYRCQADPQGADALVEGVVTSYATTPVEFNPQGRATRIEVTVTARVVLTDLATRTALWSQDHFVYRRQYTVPEQQERYFDREIRAIEEISRDFARSIVSSILEGF